MAQTHPAASSARRQEVKAQPRKPKVQAKVQKTAPKAKPAAKSSAVKPPVKAAAKSVAKVAGRPKPVSKAAAKPATKPPAKPAAKAPAKVKAPLKAVAKAGKPAAGKVSAPAPKAPAAKKQPAPAKAAKAPPAVAAQAASPSIAPPAPAAPAAPVKAGRASRIPPSPTVPPPAPVVASTAAKASYQHTMSSPVLVPPPQVTVKKDPKLSGNWKTKTAEQLSDAEVLAMPDSEYMNDKQMAFFRLKLSQLKQDILNSAGETTEHLREDTVIVPDPADRATIEEEHALELRTRDRERKLLKKIEQSIARIDAGDYGYCDETGEPIGVGRLLARPTATLSLEAQQRRELKQKMFGD
jgi:DnaK suppressor protein